MIDWGKNLGTMLISGEFHVKKSQLVLMAPCQLWVSVESLYQGSEVTHQVFLHKYQKYFSSFDFANYLALEFFHHQVGFQFYF